jgi:hypothetical protein
MLERKKISTVLKKCRFRSATPHQSRKKKKKKGKKKKEGTLTFCFFTLNPKGLKKKRDPILQREKREIFEHFHFVFFLSTRAHFERRSERETLRERRRFSSLSFEQRATTKREEEDSRCCAFFFGKGTHYSKLCVVLKTTHAFIH